MVREIQLPFGYAWIDQFPKNSEYRISEYQERVLQPCNSTIRLVPKKAALKLHLIGGHSKYGILGAEFVPGMDGICKVQAAISKNEEIGLSREYGEAVLKGSENFLISNSLLPCGTLIFAHAVQHPIDSNKAIFNILAHIVSWMIIYDLDDTPSDLLTSYIINTIQRFNSYTSDVL